jgi:hypothetical protein
MRRDDATIDAPESTARQSRMGVYQAFYLWAGGVAGQAQTRDQRINAPPFAVVANRSRNYLPGKRLHCLLATSRCR